MSDASICICPHCGTKNRIPGDKMAITARCGRCREVFTPGKCQKEAIPQLTLRCAECRTKNRVPVARLHAGAKCGRCGALIEHQGVMTGRTVMVTDADFDKTVLKSPLPVLLYAWAPWCSVCSSTGPQVEQLAAQTKGKIRVAKVNIDANAQLASKYNILSVPSFFIFDDGKLVEHLPGAVPKHELMMKMARFI